MGDLIRRDDVRLAKFTAQPFDDYRIGWNDALDAVADYAEKVISEEELERLKSAISRCNSIVKKGDKQ